MKKRKKLSKSSPKKAVKKFKKHVIDARLRKKTRKKATVRRPQQRQQQELEQAHNTAQEPISVELPAGAAGLLRVQEPPVPAPLAPTEDEQDKPG